MKIILLGPPGSGKGTQANLISKKFHLENISTGKIIRDNVRDKTEFGKLVEEIIKTGQLVSDELILEMLEDALMKIRIKNYILDGFPRTLNQALELDKFEKDIDVALLFDVPNEIILDRLLNRKECGKCGAQYNLKHNITPLSKICEKCGGALILREDDNEITIKNRLNIYKKEVEPIVDFYKNKNILTNVEDLGTIEGTFSYISEILEGLD